MKRINKIIIALGCLLFLAGCITTSQQGDADPYPPIGSPASPYTPARPYPGMEQEELNQYYGSPQAASLITGQQIQTSGVGTYVWIESKTGDSIVQVHGDAFGIVAPTRPITVTSPFSATLVLPVHFPPSRLKYVIYPVDESDIWGNGSRDMETWDPPSQPFGMSGLPLKSRQTILFDVKSEGLHILYLDAEWNGLGSVDYGFLIDITTANPTAVSYQSYPEPALVATTTPLSNSDREISALLSQYGWTINHHISSHIETLPETFAHEPDVFPYAIYWAYNNELSSEIGLDITPYLGKTIKASLFHLNENLPDEFRPHTSARAVIISHNGEIIGAWIEKVAGFACSLSRKRFDEVVMQDWSEWLVSSGVVDLENKIDRELSLKTPEDIIEEYYSALNDHDFPRLISVMSRSSITYALFVNKENDALFNHWDDSSIKKSMDNIESAKLLTVAQKGHHCLPLYEAHVDLQFVNPAMMTIPEGKNLRFVVLVEEIKGLGFRIAEINTAPGVSQRLCSPRVDY